LRSPSPPAPACFQLVDDSARPFRANRECGLDGTSDQHNTHIVEIREVWYPWHPWYGRNVKVHATLVKRGVGVARCSSEDVHPHRPLELPLWMLDSAVCCKVRVAKPGSVSVEFLRELQYLLYLAQSASGELAKEAEHQYLLNAGGTDVNVAASQAPCATPAVCMPSLETTDQPDMGGSVDRCSPEDGAVARPTPPASLRPVPRRGSKGGGR
jgi:hypothetical protein